MNSTSVTDYILKLEKLNEESRAKIDQLKNLLNDAHKERVAALNELNELKNKSSLYDTTSRVSNKQINIYNKNNTPIVVHLLDLAMDETDHFKHIAYTRAAETIADLSYEVVSGESLLNLKGIGKSIASKIDEFFEENDSDYVESVASNDYESDEESVVSSYYESNDMNSDLTDMLYYYADKAPDNFRRAAYTKAADTIHNLSYKITTISDVEGLPGIGKSITNKINRFLERSKNTNIKLADCFLKLGNMEENAFKSEAYWYAADKLTNLKKEISSSDDVKNMRGFGPSICNKIDEFLTTGSMKKLQTVV